MSGGVMCDDPLWMRILWRWACCLACGMAIGVTTIIIVALALGIAALA